MKRLFYATLFSVVTLFGMSAQANLQPLVVVKLNGYETISLKDLKDSGELEQSAVSVMLLHNENANLILNRKKKFLNL